MAGRRDLWLVELPLNLCAKLYVVLQLDMRLSRCKILKILQSLLAEPMSELKLQKLC